MIFLFRKITTSKLKYLTDQIDNKISFNKLMMINFISKKTIDINQKIILQICKLKNTHWKFGLKDQISWFKDNIKKNDIHNLCYIKNKLVGYTALRNGFYYNNKQKKKFLLFDTLVINPKYKKKHIGALMMKFNNFIIIQNKKPSFLVCKKNLIKFYQLNNWKKIPKNKYITLYKSFNSTGMTFKFEDKIGSKLLLNLQK